MFDILLEGVMQSVIRHRWWVAVIGGALAAIVFVGLLEYAGLLPS
jgi:hypothetical protein